MSAIVPTQAGLNANIRSAGSQGANLSGARGFNGNAINSVVSRTGGERSSLAAESLGISAATPRINVAARSTNKDNSDLSFEAVRQPLVYQRSGSDNPSVRVDDVVSDAKNDLDNTFVRAEAISSYSKILTNSEDRFLADGFIVLEPTASKTGTERTALSAYAQADKAIYFSGDFHSPVVGVDVTV